LEVDYAKNIKEISGIVCTGVAGHDVQNGLGRSHQNFITVF